MDRFYLLAPALLLAAAMVIAFGVYCILHALGRPPKVHQVKHNELFGPFLSSYLVWLIQPIERVLVGRMSPNAITSVSLVLCAATGIAAAFGNLPVAAWMFLFAGLFDVLDGRVARLQGKMTQSGALFDSVSDRWGEMFAFAGYAWFLRDTPWLLAVFAAFGASMMVSYTRARAEGLGLSLAGGIMQRAERVVCISGGALIAAWIGGDALVPIIGGTMALCAVTSTGTALGRWINAFRELAEREAPPLEIEQEEAPVVAQIPARLMTGSNPELRKIRVLEQH